MTLSGFMLSIENMKYFNSSSILLGLFLGFLSFSAHAEAPPKVTYDYSELAKNRTYVGGAEESDLKLLPENYFQKNKKPTNAEETSEGF